MKYLFAFVFSILSFSLFTQDEIKTIPLEADTIKVFTSVEQIPRYVRGYSEMI